MKNLLGTLPFGLILGDSEHVSNPPAPFPHLGFATGWGLATQPAQKQYVQKIQSYSPDQVTDFKSGGNLICCIRSSKSAFFFSMKHFFYLWFLSQIYVIYMVAKEGREQSLFLSSLVTHTQKSGHLFVVLLLRHLPQIFNHSS